MKASSLDELIKFTSDVFETGDYEPNYCLCIRRNIQGRFNVEISGKTKQGHTVSIGFDTDVLVEIRAIESLARELLNRTKKGNW